MAMPQFGGIPGLPTGPQSFAPPLTPEQINQLSPDDLNRLQQQLGRAGGPAVDTAVNTTQDRVARARQMAGNAVDAMRNSLTQAATSLGELPMGRLGFGAGMLAPIGTAVQEAQAERPMGAAGALLGGGAGAAIGTGIGKVALGGLASRSGIPGLIGKVGQAALPILGGLIGAPTGASAAEAARQKLTGEPTKGKEGDFQTQMAINKQLAELGTTQYRDNMGVYTSMIRDLSRDMSNQNYLDLQRNIPLINKLKNADLVRQQALLNTQGQLQGMLGVLSTGGALAQGAQAETGATLRTALTSSPYAGSVLQAPNISFGR